MGESDKKDKSDDDYEPGDDNCTSCSGIALFASKQARMTKDSNWCLGLRRRIDAKITPAQIDQFEAENIGTDRRHVITIGHSISSKWMDRKGYVPLILLGTSITFGIEINPPSSQQSGPSIGNDESFALSFEKKVSEGRQPPQEVLDVKPKVPISLEGMFLMGKKMVERGAIKQIKAMNSLAARVSSPDFPAKVSKSSSALCSSASRTAGYALKDIWILLTGWGK